MKKSLAALFALTAFCFQIHAEERLLPTTPELKFWYPPFAASQPTYDGEDTFTVDLATAEGKPMAMVKLPLAEANLETGKRYLLSFDIKAEPASGVVLNSPEPDAAGDKNANGEVKPSSEFLQLTPKWSEQEVEFTYDPTISNGEFSFFFPEAQIAKGGKVSMRSFRLVSVE